MQNFRQMPNLQGVKVVYFITIPNLEVEMMSNTVIMVIVYKD